MARNELTLEEIKDKIDSLKEEIARKQGQRDTELEALKKDYGVKNLDGAYKMLDKLTAEVEEKSRERSKLMKEANDLLEDFGLI